jgi:hypothetical protein
MVELQPSKLVVRVRFPSPALFLRWVPHEAVSVRPAEVSRRVALAFGGSNGGPKPDVLTTPSLYGWTMPEGLERSLGKNASVTVEAAARLVDVDVETIRHWSDIGSIEIEQRGDMDVVRLDRVRVLTDSSRAHRDTPFGLLRALLRDAPRTETPSVVVLQELVREKAGIAP